ncbi:MAG TPA: hypothetical protein VM557_11620 [Thermoanaerobaculia bacterium]|nr:hypothetical protein [Thermoanaerobaculia bacterium]
MRPDRSSLVLVRKGDLGKAWVDSGAIVMSNYALLEGALYSGVLEHSRAISHVILDRSADPTTFLKFLSGLPEEFRGDVLLILDKGEGYLSSISRGDGRHLYGLTALDIDFYRLAALRMEQSEVLAPIIPIRAVRVTSPAATGAQRSAFA